MVCSMTHRTKSKRRKDTFNKEESRNWKKEFVFLLYDQRRKVALDKRMIIQFSFVDFMQY